MNRTWLFSTMLFVSLSVHGTLFFSLSKPTVAAVAVPKETPQITRVVFKTPEKPLPDTPVTKAKPVHKKVEKKKSSLPKKVPKRVLELPQPKQLQAKEKYLAPLPTSVAALDPPKTSPQKAIQKQLKDDEKERYLATLLAHIESHKYYPRLARKRGIEGHVDVSFLLSSSGEISRIEITGGAAVLQRAARKAVTTALPLPKPSVKRAGILPVKYRMAFVLRE